MQFDEWWQPTEEYCNTTTEYERQRNTWEAATLAAQQEWIRQQEEITDMCIVSWVSTLGTLKDKVTRLIDWNVSVALDPAVSIDAQALIQLGKLEAIREAYQIAQACEFGYEAAKSIREKFGLEI